MINEDKNQNNKIEVKVTYDDYKNMRKIYPNKFLKLFLIPSIVWIIISLCTLIPDEEIEAVTVPELIIYDSLLVLLWLIIVFVIILITRKIDYKRFIKKNIDNIEYTLYFYEDYILKESKNVNQKIKYYDIKKYREINFMLYLVLDKNNILPVSELSLDSNLVDNIKYYIDTPSNKDNKQDVNMYIKSVNKKKNKYYIMDIILIILFILNLFTPFIALDCWQSLSIKNNAYDFYTFKYTYAVLFVLPLPLLSLILGIIYSKKGLKCIKNIVIGAIMTFILLIISSSSLLYDSTIDKNYYDINTYENIIGIELPKKIDYYSIKWDESYLQDLVSSSAKFTDKDESNRFYQDIQNSENWIKKDDIGTTMSIFVPNSLICTSKKYECYYSIYNEELNSYNILPSESGKYHIKSMIYDPDRDTLRIEDFIYDYKK